MSGRDLIGVAAVLAAAYGLLRAAGRVAAPHPATAASGQKNGPGVDSFTAWLVGRESGGDLAARNPRSTASGKYQFTRDTWVRLGGAWGSDPTRPFGGLAPSEAEQDARFAKLTAQNAAGLQRAGLAVTNATLYAAHFLGVSKAIRVLTAPASTNLAALVGSAVMAANPQLRGFTAADFRRWIGA